MKHAAIAILILSSGCVGALKSDYPERRFYTLSAQRPGAAAVPAKEGVLRIRRFTASKLFEGSELVTRTSEAEYETDFYNAFFVPPAMQLTEQTHQWMGASGQFSAVVGTGSAIPETHVLEGNVVSLYVDGRESQRAAALELQFMLVRVSVEPTTVLFQKTYKASERPGGSAPESCVKAWNAGLQKILTELEADLAKVRK